MILFSQSIGRFGIGASVLCELAEARRPSDKRSAREAQGCFESQRNGGRGGIEQWGYAPIAADGSLERPIGVIEHFGGAHEKSYSK